MIQSSTTRLVWFFAEKWLRNKEISDIVKWAKLFKPRDVLNQQRKVARAEALVIIAPIWFVGFPAILKGWIERVFTYGFAFGFTPDGWNGEMRGHVPLFKHQKALIISTTMFNERAYQGGLDDAMKKLIDDFGFRYSGIKNVEHVYFYSVSSVEPSTRQGYLQQAYCLGKEF